MRATNSMIDSFQTRGTLTVGGRTYAIARLKAAVQEIPNVLADPAPVVDILSFSPEGPVLAVRPSTANEHYWQVYFDTHRVICSTFGAAGYPVPETPLSPRTR